MKRANLEEKMKSPKRFKAEETNNDCSTPNHIDKKYSCNLLNLSDDVLLYIFKYLSSFDLMSLHNCCIRLNTICRDRTLWTKIDLRSRHLTTEQLEEFAKIFQPTTKTLAIQGKGEDQFLQVKYDFLDKVCSNCEQLQEFIVENFSIPVEKIKITDFPTTLKKLSLQGCKLLQQSIRSKSYLCKIDKHMPNLTCLILTNCNWLDSHSFMAISKVPNLREVRLNSCYRLKEDIAYPSIACKAGFKALEILDLRDTFIGDSVISSFSFTPTLTELYLDCPGSEIEQLPDEQVQQRDVVYVHLRPGLDGAANQLNQPAMFNENELQHFFNVVNNVDRCLISDRSIRTLGLHNNGHNQEILQNRGEVQLAIGSPRTSTNPNLRKLVVRNYESVTNQTLSHFIAHGPNLKFLDVTGTSVTEEGVENFKIHRPDVILCANIAEP